jgi:hypothetical protein
MIVEFLPGARIYALLQAYRRFRSPRFGRNGICFHPHGPVIEANSF